MNGKQRINPYQVFVLWALALLLSACAQLGGPTPKTFNEKTLVAIAAIDEVQKSATTLIKAGKISPDDAQNVVNTADTAQAGIAVARQISATDLNAATAKLQTVTVVLTALQAYLATKGAQQ